MCGERDKDVERDRLAAESSAVSRRNGELSGEVAELSGENESLRRRVQQLEEWLKLPPTEAADVPACRMILVRCRPTRRSLSRRCVCGRREVHFP